MHINFVILISIETYFINVLIPIKYVPITFYFYKFYKVIIQI